MLLMTTCIGSLTVYAQDDAKIAVSAGDGEQGKTTEVKFNLEGNPGIWGLKFRVGYDHSALKLTSVTNGNVFSDGDVTLPETLDKEQFVYLASANKLENITANGTVVTLSFQVAESAELKSYPITLEITQAINVDGDDIAVAAENGSVTVKAVEPENTPEPTAENTPEPSTDTPALPADNAPVEESKPVSASINEQSNNESVQTKKPEVKQKSKAPNTSDSDSLVVWGVVALGGSAAIAFVFYNRRRNNTKA